MTDDQHDPLEAFADDRLELAHKIHEQNRDAEPNDDDSGADAETVTEIARECGVDRGLVSEILLSAAEHGLVAAAKKSSGFSSSQSSVGMEKFFRLLYESSNPKLAIRLIAYALNTPALDDVIAHGCPADFARTCDCTRSNATKYLGEIQTSLGLPIRIEQRPPKSRKTFSEKQKNIWKNAPKKQL